MLMLLSLTSEVVLSTPWCPISLCSAFNTVFLYFSWRTSCILTAVLRRRRPSSSSISLSRLCISHLGCRHHDLHWWIVGLIPEIIKSITGPMFWLFLWARRISSGRIGWCTASLIAVHCADRFKGHRMMPCSSTDCTVACNKHDESSSVHRVYQRVSIGILERLSASMFSLPGRYLIVMWKSANLSV